MWNWGNVKALCFLKRGTKKWSSVGIGFKMVLLYMYIYYMYVYYKWFGWCMRCGAFKNEWMTLDLVLCVLLFILLWVNGDGDNIYDDGDNGGSVVMMIMMVMIMMTITVVIMMIKILYYD